MLHLLGDKPRAAELTAGAHFSGNCALQHRPSLERREKTLLYKNRKEKTLKLKTACFFNIQKTAKRATPKLGWMRRLKPFFLSSPY